MMEYQLNHAHTHLVALGANLSAKGCALEDVLGRAILRLSQQGFMIRSVSRFFQTPCFPAGTGPDYVNGAIALQSRWPAPQVLQRLHSVEAEFGRERIQRWGQRTLDLDLIAVEDRVLPNLEVFEHWRGLNPALQAKAAPDGLVLPHPRVQDRAFVLVPLADIAPNWRHPVLGKTTRELLAALPAHEVACVKAI